MAVYKINESRRRKLKESDVNFFKKKRTHDKYLVYVYNKNDLATRDLLNIVRKYGLSYEFPQYYQLWMGTPSDIILVFKSQDLDKAAQAFSEINDNYTPDKVKEIAQAQGVADQVQESSDDSTFQYLRRNHLQAKKDFETKGEKDNNDVLSREDKMWVAKGQMDDYERKSRKVEESVNFFKKNRSRDTYGVYVYNKDELSTKELRDLTSRGGVSMEPPKSSLGTIEDVPSSVLLTFKSSDIDKLAQVFSAINSNYSANEIRQEFSDFQGSPQINESVADPREYDLEDLGMTSEEADRAHQEADDELTRLMDRMGVDANDAANHSRWNRVVDDIAYLVASCRRYDIEPYKYND